MPRKPYQMSGKTYLVAILLFIFGLTLFGAGYFLGISLDLDEVLNTNGNQEPVVEDLRPGLKAGRVGLDGGEFYEFWIPAGTPDPTNYGLNFVFLRRTVPYSEDTETALTYALMELIKGPTEEEKALGAYSIIRNGDILRVTIKDGVAILDFSKEIDPKGGSLAIFMTTKAIETVAGQFPGVNKVKILVEGQEDALQP